MYKKRFSFFSERRTLLYDFNDRISAIFPGYKSNVGNNRESDILQSLFFCILTSGEVKIQDLKLARFRTGRKRDNS